jgi:predicted esterase YcpF (UPF0227 family)
MANYLLVKSESLHPFLFELAIHMKKRNHNIILYIINSDDISQYKNMVAELQSAGVNVIIDEQGNNLYKYFHKWADKVLWL